MPLWFDDAFGAWYLKVYSHRDKAEAQRALEFVLPWLEDPILDIGCGTGRHLRTLAESNRHAFGIDRSEDLLREGGRAKPAIGTARSDMRQLPFAQASFGSVLSMFTSFGYFDTDEDHVNLLKEWRRVTIPRGRLVLDYLNPQFVISGLQADSERVLEDGVRVVERRQIRRDLNPSRVEKRVTILNPIGEELTSYRESVALFDHPTMIQMLAQGGWSNEQTFGTYEGQVFGKDTPRMLMVSRAAS